MADGMVPAKREIRPETEPVQSVDGKGINPGSFLDASGGESIRGGMPVGDGQWKTRLALEMGANVVVVGRMC